MITIPDDNLDEFQNKKNISIDDKNTNSNRILSNINIIPTKLNIEKISKRIDSFGEEISKVNKKHKISFLDQISSGKNIADIIYIDGQSSARDSKINADKYKELFGKKVEDIDKLKTKLKKDKEIYKIKRPKRSKSNVNRKVEKVEQQCQCNIF
jgi:hypothetical protein